MRWRDVEPAFETERSSVLCRRAPRQDSSCIAVFLWRVLLENMCAETFRGTRPSGGNPNAAYQKTFIDPLSVVGFGKRDAFKRRFGQR